MSYTTNENEDGIFSRDQIESPLIDEGISEASAGGAILKKGPWTSAEDAVLVDYVRKHGEGNWNAVQKHSGLFRCGKSCRLRWANHLRPNLKKGAFTQDEERMIIELHAKIGNKWARMAAHLPGRTDNEIKNYWNTRIKRRQRAGLLPYPPELAQTMQDIQQGRNNSGDSGPHDLMQANSYEIPEVVFDSLKSHQVLLPFVPELQDISASGMLMKGLGSSQYGSLMTPVGPRPKRPRESSALFPGYTGSVRNGFTLLNQFQDVTCDKGAQPFGLLLPLDPDPTSKNLLSFGAIQGSHALSNGNFSASKPISEPMKSELPSLQYPDTDLGSWGISSSPPPFVESVDAFIQSPPNETVDSYCLSPRNSGLLDALLHEAKTLNSTKNHSSDKSSNSSTVAPSDLADSSNLNICEKELENYPRSPLGQSTTSFFHECTPVSGRRNSLDEQPPAETFTGCNIKSYLIDHAWTPDGETETTPRFDVTQPDALLDSDWLEQSWQCVKDEATMTDAIATLLREDFDNEYKHMAVGVSSSSQGWGFGSCAWNNMPAVCQMSELP